MDTSAFADNSFVSKKWINDIFKKSENSSVDDETFLQSLISKLQLHIEEVNAVIEDNCQKTTNNLPKIVNEIETLNQNVLDLAEKLHVIKQEIENIEKNTDDSVYNLEKIDDLKTTLENVKQALHEADNWSILASDIEECFDRGNVEKITSTLVSMQQSLNVLSNADDYEDKKMQLEGLKNRLEASVSPNIVKAFTTYNYDEVVKFVKMFREIERLPQLLKYYIKCQKGSLCQHWKSIVDSDQDLNLAEQLRSLYDMLLANWQKQIRWCDEVFPSVDIIDMMVELYAEVLVDLDPNLTSCMDTSLKQHEQPLLLLLEYHQSSCQFQQNLESIYMFNNDTERKPEWKPVLKSLYHPYVPYATKYGTLERQLLDYYLWNCLSKMDDSQVDFIDSIRSIGPTIPTIMSMARDAENRCMQFTHGCGVDGLVMALKGLFLKYIDKYKEICERMSRQLTNNKENWHILTSCLSFQQIIGEFLSEIKKLELHLMELIMKKKSTFKDDIYFEIILNPVAQKDFHNFLKSVTKEFTPSLLHNVIDTLEKLAYQVHQITYRVLFEPISFHLNNVKEILGKLNLDTRDLPEYSYSPLEYVTQIGEHLITLPQHLEPFLSEDNFALNSVLEIINKEAGNISVEKNITIEKGTMYANVLLMLVAHGTCQAYCDQILNIRELNDSAVRQLSADINYLGNVLDELGTGLTENLQTIFQLLRLSPDNYQVKSVGYPPKLVAAIRQIRKILPS